MRQGSTWVEKAPRAATTIRAGSHELSTKGMVTELAEDPTFLLAVEDYVKKTEISH